MHSSKSILPVVVALICAGCAQAFQPWPDSSAPGMARATTEPLAPRRVEINPESVLEAPELVSRPLPRDEAAYEVLRRRVMQQSHPDALRLAFQAYYNFRAAHPEQVRNPYLYFVDYGLDSREPRGYVFDMDALAVVDGPFTVAHGRGSAVGQQGIPTRFSNIQNSATSSLGLFLAEETYAFSGTSNGRHYRSIGLRLRGLSGTFNSAARRRGIVVHGAPYVTPEKAGRSEGCPSMEQSRAQRLIPMIANGGLVFLFSARDRNWLAGDPWIDRSAGRLASNDGVRSAP